MTQARSSINESVSRAHRILTEDLHQLADAIRPHAETSLADLRTRLGATYTHLCEHLRLEEEEGFMDDLREREPRFDRIAQELLNEHRELRQSLDALHSEAKTASSVDAPLREISAWIERVRRHEIRENDLIQESVDSDLGAQD